MSPSARKDIKILIFDSGAGGLSVAKEIMAKLPSAHYIYCADNAFFPYGLKEDKALTARIVQQVGIWYQKERPDLVVIACNTASTIALDRLREKFPCPFVGVVPAIKPAASTTVTGVIGVLATPATIARPYTQQLIAQFAATKQVVMYGSDHLVELAESKIRSESVDKNALETELKQLIKRPFGDKIDTVVLACTHFPLLKHELTQLAISQHIHWVDSGKAIAKRVESLLETTYQQENHSAKSANLKLLFSNPSKDLETHYRTFLLSTPF